MALITNNSVVNFELQPAHDLPRNQDEEIFNWHEHTKYYEEQKSAAMALKLLKRRSLTSKKAKSALGKNSYYKPNKVFA